MHSFSSQVFVWKLSGWPSGSGDVGQTHLIRPNLLAALSASDCLVVLVHLTHGCYINILNNILTKACLAQGHVEVCRSSYGWSFRRPIMWAHCVIFFQYVPKCRRQSARRLTGHLKTLMPMAKKVIFFLVLFQSSRLHQGERSRIN